MYQINIKDPFVKKDSWIKNIRKTFNPEGLADLIKKRLDNPISIGPYVSTHKGEMPADIISSLMIEDQEYKIKLAPAVGLLLYKMSNGIIPENHDIFRGIFSVIHECDLTECSTLLYNWILKKHDIFASNDIKWKSTFREALEALAQIQKKNPEMEMWWNSIWRSHHEFWWQPAFIGLKEQNPMNAAKEIELLMNRKLDKTPSMLTDIWKNRISRSTIENYIRDGLNSNSGWAGLALNFMLEKLSEDNKNELMLNLKRLQRAN